MKLTNLRKITVLLFVVLAVAALALHTGTGNLSSLGWDAIAYICPLGGIEAMLASMTLIPRPIIVIVVLLIVAAIVGKVFCAWVCPVPPIKRFFDRKSWRSLGKRKHGAPAEPAEPAEPAATEQADGASEGVVAAAAEAADADAAAASTGEGAPAAPAGERTIAALTEDEKALLANSCSSAGEGKSCSSCAEKRAKLDSRHMVLGGALLSTAIFGFPVFCLVCPVGLVFATIVVWWRFVGFAELTITLVVFPAILLLEVLVLRSWCLKFCPLGAVMSLMSLPNRFFRPHVDESKCLQAQGIECLECAKVCSEHLDPHCSDGMHECSKCGECIEHCPAQAISMPFSPKPKRKELVGVGSSDAGSSDADR